MAAKKNKTREIIKAAAKEPEILRLLKTDPAALAKRFNLKKRDLAALISADRLLVVRGRLSGTSTYTYTTGSTITGRFAIGSESWDPIER